MKKEIQIFFAALMFYTRIPGPRRISNSEEYLNKSVKYLPLAGWLIGGFSALVFYSCIYILPIPVSIVLSMAASILLTGAFHEDGIADVCDGFGGGYTRERKLEIMKDSRIGVFGTIGLIMVLGLKFILLNEIYVTIVPFAIIAAHSLSRFAAITIMNTLQYARKEEEKSKVISFVKKMTIPELIIAGMFGILPLALFQNYFYFLLIIPVFITRWLLGTYFKKQIGGYTGDCLGATQQLCEVVFYLSLLVLWKYI